MLMNINQAIIWAAGFLEGDGSFVLRKGKYVAVQASQVNPEPIADLVRWFSGEVSYHDSKNKKHKGIYSWQLTRQDGAALMMTIYSFMSEKRKSQIKKCLKMWKTVEHRRQDENYCVNGHLLRGVNLIWKTVKGVKCKVCRHCEIEQSKRSKAKRSKVVSVASQTLAD